MQTRSISLFVPKLLSLDLNKIHFFFLLSPLPPLPLPQGNSSLDECKRMLQQDVIIQTVTPPQQSARQQKHKCMPPILGCYMIYI